MNEIDSELGRARGGLPGGPSPALLRSLAGRAEAEGLVDVAYAQVDSPLGPLTVAASRRGLLRVAYPEHPLDTVLGDLARDVSPRVLEAPGASTTCAGSSTSTSRDACTASRSRSTGR